VLKYKVWPIMTGVVSNAARFGFSTGIGLEFAGLESPGNMQLFDIINIDLIQRGIPAASRIITVAGPFCIVLRVCVAPAKEDECKSENMVLLS
jgi:hypothetical protein